MGHVQISQLQLAAAITTHIALVETGTVYICLQKELMVCFVLTR